MVAGDRKLTIASRGSQLALWQANWVADELRRAHPGLTVDIEIVRTTGDRILDVPLARIGDRGLFTKEVDEVLLAGRAQLAVHSLKDVPTAIPADLTLAAITTREDPRDVLIGPAGSATTLTDLPKGARVGTSSLRRRAQLFAARPDLEVLDLRGNLNTRLARLDEGAYDAIILAAAGVLRLGWSERISQYLDPPEWLPAVGQGALAIVAKDDDEEVLGLLMALNDPLSAASATAERAFLRSLEGGCQVPIAALALQRGNELHLDGLVADLDGTTILRDSASGSPANAAGIGLSLAAALSAAGATGILEGIRSAAGQPKVSPP